MAVQKTFSEFLYDKLFLPPQIENYELTNGSVDFNMANFDDSFVQGYKYQKLVSEKYSMKLLELGHILLHWFDEPTNTPQEEYLIELEKLLDMHSKTILNQEEFDEGKRAYKTERRAFYAASLVGLGVIGSGVVPLFNYLAK